MSPAPRAIAIVVAVVMFMGILEGTIISTALPHMARDFGVAPVDLGIGITAYLLVSAMFLPISSWVAERLGTKRVLMTAILGFALASLLCGASTTLTGFVAARALQAFFASLMVPVANLVLLRVTPKRQLVQMTAISTTPALIAPVIGPPLGGFITAALGWQYIFFINLPLAVIGIALVWRMVPDLRAEVRAAFDLRGFVLVAAALAGAVLAMERLGAQPAAWHAPALLAIAAGATGVLAMRHMRRAAAPIVPLAALRHGTFRSIAFGAGFLMRLPFMGQALLLPLFFQVGFGLSPVATGVLLLAQNLGDLLLKPIAGAAITRLGFRRALITGTTTMVVGIAGIGLLHPAMPFWLLCLALLVVGAARSIAFTGMMALTFADVDQDELAGATVLNNLANALSAALGVSLASLLVNLAVGEGGGAGSLADYRLAILCLAGVGAMAIPLFARLPRDAGAAVSGHRLGAELA
ncbi:MFS transporter [Sphingomonas sp. RT2P30]|uniref:MFS transporter n=1 Tax=Parasphingomonas halimpatiens TaxID=3096162 RepID=UPI002FCAB495